MDAQSTKDYTRIEAAIGFLVAQWQTQPSLGAVAAHVGLSEAHFDRMFTRWAGVSPMRFLRHLTKEEARRRLRNGASVLDTAIDVGLSGPSRLHDLLVTCEAVTPGQLKTAGAGLEIRHGIAATPFGEALLAWTPRGICMLGFVHAAESAEDLRAELRADWAEATLTEDADGASALGREIFGAPREPLRLHLRGTNFQLKVWQALLAVPPGALTTYGALARQLGQPTASRAVGGAVGANPVSYLVPCHRVIQTSGAFGHYRWGAPRKLALCGWEATRPPVA